MFHDPNLIKIGDPVEVRLFTQEENKVVESWTPATVTNVFQGGVGVAFSDHRRMDVFRGNWRRSFQRNTSTLH